MRVQFNGRAQQIQSPAWVGIAVATGRLLAARVELYLDVSPQVVEGDVAASKGLLSRGLGAEDREAVHAGKRHPDQVRLVHWRNGAARVRGDRLARAGAGVAEMIHVDHRDRDAGHVVAAAADAGGGDVKPRGITVRGDLEGGHVGTARTLGGGRYAFRVRAGPSAAVVIRAPACPQIVLIPHHRIGKDRGRAAVAVEDCAATIEDDIAPRREAAGTKSQQAGRR
ncbi:MAG: hypothetical protein JWR69_4732 [Pedosphaera sp.]|nr:hypothetical protein [Pedosphaera sp.]